MLVDLLKGFYVTTNYYSMPKLEIL